MTKSELTMTMAVKMKPTTMDRLRDLYKAAKLAYGDDFDYFFASFINNAVLEASNELYEEQRYIMQPDYD